MKHNHRTQPGFTLVEIIIALAIATAAYVGLLQLALLQVKAASLAAGETQAYFLADEALEATRIVRDEGWANVGSLAKETLYYPVLQGGTWALSSSNPGAINGFTRSVVFHQVFRDGNGNIASSGSSDANTVLAQAQVSFTPQGGGTQTISLETYLTNWQKK